MKPEPIPQYPESWRRGYIAGLNGKTPQSPADVDGLAYQAGIVEGLAVAIDGGVRVDYESQEKKPHPG